MIAKKAWYHLAMGPLVMSGLASAWMPGALGATTFNLDDEPAVSAAAIAQRLEPSDDSMDQVTSVSQLTDVRPTDWAFQALQSLVERYGCIVGYPDRTYRGNRALSRYEFAAGLNACLDRVNELISASTADFVKKEDLELLEKLQAEYATDLATLRGRVDGLESRTATLEKQQFSTTTKLTGESVFALAGVAAGEDVTGSRIPRNPMFGTRVRLDFDTSFTGADLLRTRLQAFTFTDLSTVTGSPEGALRFGPGFGGQENGDVGLDALLYQFPLGENTLITLEANAGATDDFADTINPFFDGDGGSGALSHFGTRNSIYYLVDGTGIAVQHQFGEALELSLGYLASDAATPVGGSGLFNGPYGAIAQLTFRPAEQFTLGLTYINAYNTDFTSAGSTGSLNANLFSALSPFGRSVVTNSYGIEASFRPSDRFVINGWVGYTQARVLGLGDADIWNWAVALGFPDLIKAGSLAGIVVGMEPKLTGLDGSISRATGIERDRNTSLHIEAFYQFQLSDNIAITPGLIWLTAPNHDNRNDDVVIGTIRTTFTF